VPAPAASGSCIPLHEFQRVTTRCAGGVTPHCRLCVLQCSVPITFSMAYFVLPLWGTMLCTAVAACVAVKAMGSIWRMQPSEQRDKGQLIGLVAGAVACYWSPMLLQAGLDVASGQAASVPVLCALGLIAALGTGGFLFAKGLPERLVPRKLDVWCSSHALMHVSVLASHVCEYAFLWAMLARQQQQQEGGSMAAAAQQCSAAQPGMCVA